MADKGNTGIYEIVNLVNGKRYIGSAVNFKTRWAEHRRRLSRGCHHNVVLQRAWIRYGADSFSFRVITICDRARLLELEQYEIDRLLPEYNICRIAGSTLGLKPSAKTRALLSARMRGNQHTKGMKFSPEICARMGAGKTGKKRPPRSDEHRKRISESNKGHQRSLGRKLSDATKAKLAAASIGKRHSLETRLKRCTLNEDQVRGIRRMRASGLTYKQIAKEFGIKPQLVGRVCMRLRYEWIDPSELPLVRDGSPRGWKHSSEASARHSAAGKARWAARRAAGVANPRHRSPRTAEQRLRLSVASKEAWDRRKASELKDDAHDQGIFAFVVEDG